MGKLFCIMGKSASGKDTVYKALVNDPELHLHTVVPYTARPIREGEAEGENYYFVDESVFCRMAAEGKIIEDRAYNTVDGLWRYFTADDGQIDFSKGYFIIIGTLEAYVKMAAYFGRESVIPIYIEVEDGQRLHRAIAREEIQKKPKYAELCRRFLADNEDFSSEKLAAAGVCKFYENNCLEQCINDIRADILKELQKQRKETPEIWQGLKQL